MTNDYIDLSAVEPLVREAFAAAVARDPARSAVALAAMEGQETECVTLAAMIETRLPTLVPTLLVALILNL